MGKLPLTLLAGEGVRVVDEVRLRLRLGMEVEVRVEVRVELRV